MNMQLWSTMLTVSNVLGSLSATLLLSEPCPEQQDLSMTVDDCIDQFVVLSNGV